MKEIIKDSNTILVDVRTTDEFAEGSAKGAVNIPLDTTQCATDRLNGKEHIVVFCRSGNRSAHAKQILEQLGYKNVIYAGTWEDVVSMQE
jgi:phage shock protein E